MATREALKAGLVGDAALAVWQVGTQRQGAGQGAALQAAGLAGTQLSRRPEQETERSGCVRWVFTFWLFSRETHQIFAGCIFFRFVSFGGQKPLASGRFLIHDFLLLLKWKNQSVVIGSPVFPQNQLISPHP